jgi:hypothetical protein
MSLVNFVYAAAASADCPFINSLLGLHKYNQENQRAASRL